MPQVNAETLKGKLSQTINKHMLVKRKGKTVAISDIADNLNGVGTRQIYKWLKAEQFPPDADNLIGMLQDYQAELESQTPGRARNIERSPRNATVVMMPFQVTIPKSTMRITQDEAGNITVSGQLAVKLV